MTPAPTITKVPRYFPTGNLHISLPAILLDDGGVYRVGALHLGCNTLLEFCGLSEKEGQPLVRLFVEDAEKRQTLAGALRWERRNYWLPSFRFEGSGLNMVGTIFAPLGEKGFVYLLELTKEGPAEELTVGIEGWWHSLEATIFSSKEVEAKKVAWHDPWTGSVVFEARVGLPLIALGIQPSMDMELSLAEEGGVVHYRLDRRMSFGGGETIYMAFYFALGVDSDGARTTALHLRRRGWKALLEETVAWLEKKTIRVKDGDLERVLNENLFFNYFFAQGDCLDTDDLVLVTSRSPYYYVSAAFWARDSFLWSFPALLLVDKNRARQALLVGVTHYLRHVGEHALYLNGTVLYPGFELDEVCAPLLALEHYLLVTKDSVILEHPRVREALSYLLGIINSRKHAEVDLYSTFLLPTDDPATYPFVTYDNILVWKALLILAEIWQLLGKSSLAAKLRGQAEVVQQAVWEHCVTDGPQGPMFAWAVDLAGNVELRDEPPGSLTLLPYYGFCETSHPVYENTVRRIYSRANPYFFQGHFPGVGSAHFSHPSTFDLCNRLLSGRGKEVLPLLRSAPLDQGLACESFDPETGIVRTGAAFASCAGFLAFALTEFLSVLHHDI
ncbi:hypothetical protein HKBW3S25_00023 [Candidatus Hakubella thermalkaliphila]|uniref:Metal-independent alpha-mannosidase n=2 Tax=Candidatus Hakubella thermalkaliphila TaxID=2754717 RepID=A0A6V8NWF8_9ACTN|nr:hypothetical protein HKBW3S25_00023 [Candidatus Hakubella thermalkaliphila]